MRFTISYESINLKKKSVYTWKEILFLGEQQKDFLKFNFEEVSKMHTNYICYKKCIRNILNIAIGTIILSENEKLIR